MTQLYYRDLRRRVEALEDQYFPEPDPIVTVIWINPEDGLPLWISIVGEDFYWERKKDEPIPPEILEYAEPEARAEYEAKQRSGNRRAPPKA